MNYKRGAFSFLLMHLEKISAFAPLPIRIMAGIAFIIHGLPKFENLQGTQGFFASVGIPADLALLIGLLEVIGGVLLIVGLLTRITAILFYYRNDLCCSYSESRQWFYGTRWFRS